jgi:hypothetical protein
MGERPTGNRNISADHVSDKAENIPVLATSIIRSKNKPCKTEKDLHPLLAT